MAYPFGTYDHRIPAILEKEGILYARTTKPDPWIFPSPTSSTPGIQLPPQLPRPASPGPGLPFHRPGAGPVLCLGHSYEFDVDNNWDNMEDLLTLVSGKEDTWYATNLQICRYLTAMRELKVQGGKLVNPTNTPLWVEVDGEVQVI